MHRLTFRPFFAGLLPGLLLAGLLTVAISPAHATGTHRTAASPLVKLGAAHLVVTPKGRTLYVFAADSKTKSTCYNQCAKYWPPWLVAKGTTPAAHIPGIPGAFGITVRSDGTHQLTYYGAPLYLFALDKAAGDIKGQGVVGFGAHWWAVVAGGS